VPLLALRAQVASAFGLRPREGLALQTDLTGGFLPSVTTAQNSMRPRCSPDANSQSFFPSRTKHKGSMYDLDPPPCIAIRLKLRRCQRPRAARDTRDHFDKEPARGFGTGRRRHLCQCRNANDPGFVSPCGRLIFARARLDERRAARKNQLPRPTALVDEHRVRFIAATQPPEAGQPMAQNQVRQQRPPPLPSKIPARPAAIRKLRPHRTT